MTETLRMRQRTAALLLTAALALGAMGAAATAQPAFADEPASSPTVAKVAVKKPSATSSSAITAKWTKAKKAVSGYQIRYSTKKSMSGAKTIKVGKNVTSKKISGLKANTKYYVQVRAYLKKGAKTYRSAWSTKTSVKTKAKAVKKSSGGTVYITNTGTKYHRDGCSSLRRSKHSISKSEAQRQGYTACKVCRP